MRYVLVVLWVTLFLYCGVVDITLFILTTVHSDRTKDEVVHILDHRYRHE